MKPLSDPGSTGPQHMAAPPRIFISYSRRNLDEVDELVRLLEARGVDVWIDREDIPLTADFISEIENGIAAAEIVLAVLTPDSAASSMCQMELNTAHKLGKRIVPIRLSPLSVELDPPEVVARLNWIPYSPDHREDAVSAVVDSLSFDQEFLQTHTWLVLRARDWDRNGSRSSGLLRGPELKKAVAWRNASAGHEPAPTPAQMQFINASLRHAGRVRIIQAGVGVLFTLAVAVAAWQASIAVRRRIAADLESKAVQVVSLLDGPNQAAALGAIAAAARSSMTHFGRLSPTIKGALFHALARVREIGQYQDDQAQITSLAVNPLSGQIVVAYRGGHKDAGAMVAGAVWDSLRPRDRRLLHTPEQTCDTYELCHTGSCVIITDHRQIRSVIGLADRPVVSPSLLASLQATAADVTASGAWLLLGTRKGQVVKIDIARNTSTVMATLQEPIRLVALNPSGQRALIGTESGSTRIIDLAVGSVLRLPSLTLKEGDPFAFGANAASVFSAGESGEILRHEPGNREASLFARAGKQRVGLLASSPDGSLIAATSDAEGMVYVADGDGTLVFNGGVYASVNPRIGFSADGSILYAAGYLDRIIRSLDMKSEPTLLRNIAFGSPIWKVAFCGTSDLLAWGDDSGRLGLLDTKSGERIATWNVVPANSPINLGIVEELACMTDRRVVSLHTDGQIRAFNDRGHLLKSWKSADRFEDFAGLSEKILWAAADKAVYQCDWDGTTHRLFDIALDDAHRLAIDPYRGAVAIGSSGAGYIEVHSLADGHTLVPKYRAHIGLVMSLSFIPWNGFLASGGTVGTTDLTPVSLWSREGSRIKGISAYSSMCSALAVEPNSHILITGGYDGIVRMWDDFLVQVGPRLANHKEVASSIAVSREGIIATAGSDGHIQLHDIRDQSLLDRATHRLHAQ